MYFMIFCLKSNKKEIKRIVFFSKSPEKEGGNGQYVTVVQNRMKIKST